MAAPKLTPTQQEDILVWMCEGLTDSDVLKALNKQHEVNLSYQALTHYRIKWVKEIDEAEAQALETAKRQGWGRRSYRVSAICKKLDKLDAALDESALSQWGNLGREMREWMNELREELNQHAPSKHEIEANVRHSGEIEITDEQSAAVLAELADLFAGRATDQDSGETET